MRRGAQARPFEMRPEAGALFSGVRAVWSRSAPWLSSAGRKSARRRVDLAVERLTVQCASTPPMSGRWSTVDVSAGAEGRRDSTTDAAGSPSVCRGGNRRSSHQDSAIIAPSRASGSTAGRSSTYMSTARASMACREGRGRRRCLAGRIGLPRSTVCRKRDTDPATGEQSASVRHRGGSGAAGGQGGTTQTSRRIRSWTATAARGRRDQTGGQGLRHLCSIRHDPGPGHEALVTDGRTTPVRRERRGKSRPEAPRVLRVTHRAAAPPQNDLVGVVRDRYPNTGGRDRRYGHELGGPGTGSRDQPCPHASSASHRGHGA